MTDTTTTTTQTGQTAGTTTTQQTATPWHTGKLDGELLGHAQTMGWDKKDAADVAIEAIKAHREARGFIGLPETRLLKLPADPAKDSDGMRAVFQKLGMPADAKDYDFSAVKRADGTALDQKFADTIRAAAFEANLTKDGAARVAASVAKMMDADASEKAAVAGAKLTEAKANLAKNWGPNFEANKFIAGQAAQKLGIPAEAINALEGVAGYDKVMEMFRTIGVKMGEARFIAGEGGNENGVMSREQAEAKLSELKNDKAFGERLLKGDTAARREWDALHNMLFASQAA